MQRTGWFSPHAGPFSVCVCAQNLAFISKFDSLTVIWTVGGNRVDPTSNPVLNTQTFFPHFISHNVSLPPSTSFQAELALGNGNSTLYFAHTLAAEFALFWLSPVQRYKTFWLQTHFILYLSHCPTPAENSGCIHGDRYWQWYHQTPGTAILRVFQWRMWFTDIQN